LAAAGLWSTPSNLCRFAIELQKSIAGGSNKGISREIAVKMLASGIGNWGLGVRLSESMEAEKRSFSHGGNNEGFIYMLFAFANKGQGAAIMTNSANRNEIVFEILLSPPFMAGGSCNPKRRTCDQTYMCPLKGIQAQIQFG
jgi:hypothetical protein